MIDCIPIHAPSALGLLAEFECKLVPAITRGDWEGATSLLHNLTPLTMGIPWIKTPDPRLRPAKVHVGWHGTTLWILAELCDDDIFNNATADNQRIWTLGDTFEIFLRPGGQEAYWELHVEPANRTLRLRFPSELTIRSLHGRQNMLEEFISPEPVFESWTEVCEPEGMWRALAAIDMDIVSESGAPRLGDEWLVLFGRYDYTREDGELGTPCTSTTARLPVCNFHRHKYYQRMRFTE